MGKLVKVLLVAVVLFSAAAGGSWFLQQKLRAESEEHQLAEGTAKGAKDVTASSTHTKGNDAAPAKGSLRPPYVPEADKLSQIANSQQAQAESLKAREQQFVVRKSSLEVILQDIRSEQKSLDEVRKNLAEEMQRLTDKLNALEKKADETTKLGATVAYQKKDLDDSILRVDDDRNKKARESAKLFDAMETEAAARTMQGLVENGKLDSAVLLLAGMKERQAAQVLEKLSNSALAGQLIERLLVLKATGKKTQ